MCGIAAGSNPNLTEQALTEALTVLAGRGPDLSRTLKIDETAWMGFNLLGLASPEPNLLMQPFQTESKDLSVCVNGEIYNSAELRRSLIAKGYQFKTQSDCEVVLWGLECEGESFFSKLNGEFAVVAYFKNEKRWLCAVDHVGTKPLKYSFKNGFKVASSVQALRKLGVKAHLDQVACLFSLYNAALPVGRTLFSDIHVIPPGHLIQVDSLQNLTLKKYATYERSRTDADGTLESHIEDAVIRRLPRHFRTAVALSSGIDSSIIASILKRKRVDFSCYSIDFVGTNYSERSDIEAFCQRQGLTTTFVSIKEEDLVDKFVASIGLAENMAINPHSAGKLILNEFIAKQGHRVCFTGDGADELFWGYSHFHAMDDFQFIRDANFIGFQFAQLLKPDHRGPMTAQNLFSDFKKMNPNPDVRELYYQYWFSEYGLKVLGDSQSTNVSVELRHPFVDRNLMHFASANGSGKDANAPSKQLLRGEMKKFDLAQSQMPKKPFTAPLITHRWLSLFDQYLFGNSLEKLNLFDQDVVRNYVLRLKQNHQTGEHRTSSVVLTQLLSLAIIARDLCDD